MALLQLHTLARLAAELPSMDDALDELIARAHQVDSEAAADAALAQASHDAELDALRAQVTALETRLAEAKPARPAAIPPPIPRVPVPAPPARRLPWLGLAGAFAAGLVTTGAIYAFTRGDAPQHAPVTVAPPPAPAPPPPVPVVTPPPSPSPLPPPTPAAVASPQPVRRRPPPVVHAPAKRADLIDPFAPADEPVRHPTDTPSTAKSPGKPHGELIDPFSSQ